MLRQAVGHLSASHAAGIDLMLTVNVSGRTMDDREIGGEFITDLCGLLRELGVDYGQGYHLGRPTALDQSLPYLTVPRSSV